MKTAKNTGKGATAASKKGETAKGAGKVESKGAEVKTAEVKTRIVAEILSGQVADGSTLNVEVRRQHLSVESKVACMKRLLMTQGQTKESILAHCAKVYGDKGSNASTLNTVRADLSRTLGRAVLATGWRTDGNVGITATAAVAKLRTHELGNGKYVADVKKVELVQAAKVEEKKGEASK